jgi:hypothetical protein
MNYFHFAVLWLRFAVLWIDIIDAEPLAQTLSLKAPADAHLSRLSP